MKDKLGNVVVMLGIVGLLVFAGARDPQVSGYAKILFTEGPAAVVAQYKRDNAAQAEPTIDETNEAAAKELLSLINDLRQKNGLAKLTLDIKLCEAARYRAGLLKKTDSMEHNIPSEGTPDATLKKWGVSYSRLAENIAAESHRGSIPQTVNKLHQNLCNSSGHLANMLIPGIRKLGVGVAMSGTVWYLCEVFIAP